MTALLILKQKIKEFYGEHDTWILPILKFILAFGFSKALTLHWVLWENWITFLLS